MIYSISAMVVYTDQIEAETEEEALDDFVFGCPYDIDNNAHRYIKKPCSLG